jgi:pyruvate/2-oxoglutarate dehydrogenase complex dihydrolipoamide acyltransferase (E2) component
MDIVMRLPQFSMADNEATILKWLKNEGDPVQAGESIVEVETAKVTVTLEAPESGVLSRIVAADGSICTSGDTIALIARSGA